MTGTTLVVIDVDAIDPHPHNPRRDLGDLTELAASIEEVGVLEPIVVVPAGDRFTVLLGHRRHAASRIAKRTDVPSIVRPDLVGKDAEQLEAMLIENLQRVELTPVEESQAYQELLDLGLDIGAIASKTGRSRKTIGLRLGLARLGDKTLERVHTRQITLEEAEVIAANAKTPEHVRMLERAAGTPDFRYAVQRVNQAKDNAARIKKVTKLAEAAGLPVVIAGPGYPWSTKEKPLTELGMTAARHETCPGHCAIVRNYGDTYDLGCVDPAEHGHTKADARAPRLTKAQKAEAAAAEARAADLTAAVATRRAWLAEQLGRAKPSAQVTDTLAAPLLIEEALDAALYDERDVVAMAAAFGFTIPDAADGVDQWEKQRATLAAFVEQTRMWQANQVVALLVWVAVEAALPSDGNLWQWQRPETVSAYELLVDAGYELSTVEQVALIRKPAIEDVELEAPGDDTASEVTPEPAAV